MDTDQFMMVEHLKKEQTHSKAWRTTTENQCSVTSEKFNKKISISLVIEMLRSAKLKRARPLFNYSKEGD